MIIFLTIRTLFIQSIKTALTNFIKYMSLIQITRISGLIKFFMAIFTIKLINFLRLIHKLIYLTSFT